VNFFSLKTKRSELELFYTKTDTEKPNNGLDYHL